MSTYAWEPSVGYIENARVTKFARRHGIASISDLRARSVADICWYWDSAIEDLGLPFRTPYSVVVDLSAGIEHPEWFVGSTLNIVDACLSRWTADGADEPGPALIHERETGEIRTLSYRELTDQVRRAAAGLRSLGLRAGDTVALFLPMTPEAVVAAYAVAWLGAILVPLFSGFAPGAIASRLQDADVKAVIVAQATVRRGKTVPMLDILRQALTESPSVKHLIVVPAEGQSSVVGNAVSWSELLDRDPGTAAPPQPMRSTEPLLLGYTSGTTGRPKGAVHTHHGFLVKTASEIAYSFDLNAGEVFAWITDMGWIMGPLSVIGTHANGGTLLLYEGSPDVPDVRRLWQLVERHRIAVLGVSPTLIRSVRADDGGRPSFDSSSVRILGSTGEPWDPASYEWLAREVFGGRVPMINFSGGTEVGGSLLAPYPVEKISSCSLGGPSLGMDVDVVDDSGRSVRGMIGELVCRQPWPSMTRGVWKDEARYLESYWSTYPGIWRHGDFALIDKTGQWFVLGRSDDVMNIAGKRLAPAEVESIIADHPGVAEAAVVGVPDPEKGEVIWSFWVSRPGVQEDLSADLADLVAQELGRPFTPARVVRVDVLPKTRSAKILRRVLRAAAVGSDPGDLSSAENPDAVQAIQAALDRTSGAIVGPPPP